MNRYTYALFAFFLISLPVVGQIPGAVMVGPSHSKEEVAKAQQIVSDSQPANYQWNVGDFQIFQKGEKAKGALLWQVSDESIVTIKDIPPNTLLLVDGVRAGETVAKDHEFPPQKDSYWRFKAVKQGQTTIWIFANGENGGPPVVIAKMSVTVGKPKPPIPPTPDLTDFEKKLKTTGEADIKAGKGSKEHALLLASVYRSAANALPATSTVGELYKQLQTAFSAAGVPPVAQSLPTMRKAIAEELDKRLPTEADKQLTLEDRNRISAAFTAMADALEAAFQ